MNKTQLEQLIRSDEVAGRIIRNVAELEWYLDLGLTRYFSSQERFYEFMDVIIDHLTFADKINILRGMQLPAKMISQPNAVKSLEKFLKLRNVLAHSSYISEKDLDKLHTDNEIMMILEDYPTSYTAEIVATKNRLNRLLHSWIVRKRKYES